MIYYDSKFNFYDLKNDNRWSIKIPKSRFPWWILQEENRIPNTTILNYFSILNFLFCSKNNYVNDLILGSGRLYKFFWEPLTLGILNTNCKEASAYLLYNVLKKSFLKGGKYCGIIQPKNNWNETLINPALNFLKKKRIEINYNSILKKIETEDELIKKLIFNKKEISINKNDRVIMSLSLNGFNKVFPKYNLPNEFNTIVNIHFKVPEKISLNKKEPILGLINSKTHWIFIKKKYISITISDANELEKLSSEDLAILVWNEIKRALDLKKIKIPEYKVLREKKATYKQSPGNINLVKNINKLPKNLYLAGDWTVRNFPSTIESSILSGKNSVNK